MKKLLILLVLPFLFLFTSSALGASNYEKIDNFAATITINKDASINVKEIITYNFGTNQKHGIFRDIPTAYASDLGNLNLDITNVKVTDEAGLAYTFVTSLDGGKLDIKIGDANVTVSGVKTYVINYTVAGAINYFEGHDELYWNVTGNDRQQQIDKAEATIIYPQAEATGTLQTYCYAGVYGAKTKCAKTALVGNGIGVISGVNFKHGLLNAGEGLTVVVGFPAGQVIKPTKTQTALKTTSDNKIIILPIVIFIIMFGLWYKKGRDPKGQGVVVAEFEAPDKLTPAEVGLLADETVNTKDVVAEIIYLAVKGYLKITHVKSEGLFSSTDYVLDKLKPAGDDLTNFEVKLLDSLFLGGSTQTKLSNLKTKFSEDLREIKSLVNKALTAKKYFLANPIMVRAGYMSTSATFILIMIIRGKNLNFISATSLIICALIVLIFGYKMPVKTKAGVLAKEKIMGLKLYLTVAEKDRLNFHNAPEKNAEHFEKLLPYAIALGVETKWAQQFEGLAANPPRWYSDYNMTAFSYLALTHSLGGFKTVAATTLGATASHGGSGLGGGGFSGGGFGGGGGGSW